MKSMVRVILLLACYLTGTGAWAQEIGPHPLICATEEVFFGHTASAYIYWRIDTHKDKFGQVDQKTLDVPFISNRLGLLALHRFEILSYSPNTNGDYLLRAKPTSGGSALLEMTFTKVSGYYRGSVSGFPEKSWGENFEFGCALGYGGRQISSSLR